MMASGPSSGSKDGVPRRREPQIEEDKEIKPEPKVEVKLEEKKEPSPKGTLSLALQRIHDKLQSPTELLKLHLKHYHMTTEQFKRRTSALKLPKEIYDEFDQITKSCDTCSKAKIAPSRAKVSKDGGRQWKSLSDNSQRSSTWHLFVDHGVKCRTLMIHQILIKRGKSIFPW